MLWADFLHFLRVREMQQKPRRRRRGGKSIQVVKSAKFVDKFAAKKVAILWNGQMWMQVKHSRQSERQASRDRFDSVFYLHVEIWLIKIGRFLFATVLGWLGSLQGQFEVNQSLLSTSVGRVCCCWSWQLVEFFLLLARIVYKFQCHPFLMSRLHVCTSECVCVCVCVCVCINVTLHNRFKGFPANDFSFFCILDVPGQENFTVS